jgi:hypothetical protein
VKRRSPHKKLLKVAWVKALSRARVKTPRPQVIPDKRQRDAVNRARAIASNFGIELGD